MRKGLLTSLLLAFVVALPSVAAAGDKPDFSEGQWHRATLEIDAEREIPFFLWLPDDDSQDAVIRNGEEDVAADFRRTGDGFVVDFPHYDSRIEARAAEAGFEGQWRKLRRGGIVMMLFDAAPIEAPRPLLRFRRAAHASYERFPRPKRQWWAVDFSESGPAVAEWRLPGRTASTDAWAAPAVGTIQTTTGDYRFLAGVVRPWPARQARQTFRVSVFDGAHAFLFEGRTDESGERMRGHFYSGDWWRETFTARRLAPGETVELPDPFDEVELTSGDGRLHLPVLREPPYVGAPTIVQIFGTWCPNCHDEAPALVDLYERHHDDGLQILGLAYEHTGDDPRSRRQVERFKERYGIDWEIQIQGDSDKENASASLPDLSAVKSYPTTIWINRDGSVRAVHSGFSGPATGERHEELLEEFERLTREILGSEAAAAR